MIEVTEAERNKRASKLFTDIPCIWLFSFLDLLADELGIERDKIRMTTLKIWDKLEAQK